jgi:hypothetical protein
MPSSKKTDIFNKEFLDKMNVKTDLDPDNIKSASAAVKKLYLIYRRIREFTILRHLSQL